MMQIKNLWNNFKGLKWYWKILAAIPLILLFVFMGLYFLGSSVFFSKSLRKHFEESEDQFDKILLDVERDKEKRAKIDKKIKEIEAKEKQIERNQEEIGKNYGQRIQAIGNANDDIDQLINIISSVDRESKI